MTQDVRAEFELETTKDVPPPELEECESCGRRRVLAPNTVCTRCRRALEQEYLEKAGWYSSDG